MSSVTSYPTSTRAMSTIYDINDFQLCLILQSTIPRLEVLHKILNFIKTTKLDGKAFMGLSNKKLADLASHDPLTISRFQGLREAQAQDIQFLLESRWKRPQSPEPTITALEETSYTEDTHDEEESLHPVSIPHAQTHPSNVLPVPSDSDSHNLALDTALIIEAASIFTDVGADTQTSTDAAQSGPNGSSLNRESSTYRMAPDETPIMNLEPAVAAELELASPIDPHSVPLPQPHDSELDVLNVEEGDICDDDETFSEEAIDSELEADMDGLSSDDDTSDDESQAWSLVGNEEIGGGHVSIENEAEDLQGESSSPVDASHEPHIEPQSVTPEDPSIVDASNVDASSAAQPPPVDESDPGIDRIISADVGTSTPSEASEPDGQHGKGIEVQDSHQEEAVSLPTLPLAENDVSQLGISPTISDDLPSSTNVLEPEISADVPEAKESSKSTTPAETPTETIETGQSSPADDGPDPPQAIHATLEQPSTLPPEPVTPGFIEDDEANAEPTSASMEENTPEVTQPSETLSTEEPSEEDVPLDEQANSMPIANEAPTINLEESHSEGVHAEQPIPSEEPSASPFESATPEDDQANTASITPPAGPLNMEQTTPEVTHLSGPGSAETPSGTVVNDLQEEQADSQPVTNEASAVNLEETQGSHSEPLQFNPVSHNPSEAHGESAPTTGDSAVVHPFAEELDPITSEDFASSPAAPIISVQDDGVPVVDCPVKVSVEFDISPSASPSSSTRSVFSDSPFSNRFHSEFHLVAPVSPVLCLDKCNVLLFCEGICEDYSTFLTSPSIGGTQLLPFSSQFTDYEEANFIFDDDAPAANELRLVDHPLPSINDDTEPDDPMSFVSLEDFFYGPSALEESIHRNGEPASSANDDLIDLLDEHVPIEVQAEDPSASEPISVPVLLDEDRAETSGPASVMREADTIVTIPGASGMNEGHLNDDNRVEETAGEIVQEASNEATSAMHDGEPVVTLPGASGMREEEETSKLSNETVPRASDDATSAMHDSDPVAPLPATPRVNEGQLTGVSDNNQDEAPPNPNETVPQAPHEAIPDSDPVVPLPAASAMDEEEETSMLSNETVPRASDEATSTMDDSNPGVSSSAAPRVNEGQFTGVSDSKQDEAPPNETVSQAPNEAIPDSGPVVPLPAEEEETSMLSNETVPRASEATSEMHDSDPVFPLPATPRVNEEPLTDVADNNQDEAPVPQAPNEATPIHHIDPVAVPLPAASAMDDLIDVDDNQEEPVQEAYNESTPDEPMSDTEDRITLHAVEPSRFKGLPPIDTNITSLSDDLSAYMSPENCFTNNPIMHASYPTPFSSRPRLSPGSPGSSRTFFPMRESFTSDRAIANYTQRLHEALERPAARSIAIQTDEERSAIRNVASVSVSPRSILSSPFRLFQFGL